MARPRKPDDPERRREIPCDRCGGGYYLVVRWGPGDEICGYCYQQAKRTRGTCSCGHVGVLPGRVDGEPVCRTCAGITLNIDCVSCGAEDELYRHGLCWHCTLSDTVDRLLTDPETGAVAQILLPLAEALKSMERANSGLTWINQTHVTTFLKELAIHPRITHEGIDELPRSRTRDYVRGLLVEHGVLPRRDEAIVRYQQWARSALERLTHDDNRAIIDRYVRWHHLRRMHEMETVPNGTFLRSKQTVTVAINFLNWLHEQEIPSRTSTRPTSTDGSSPDRPPTSSSTGSSTGACRTASHQLDSRSRATAEDRAGSSVPPTRSWPWTRSSPEPPLSCATALPPSSCWSSASRSSGSQP